MSFKNIKANNQGFTIVELLIVVVVIAILAAITIVSYNGITNRANASAARSTAGTVQKKIELYQAENGRYPLSMAEMSASQSDSWYLSTTSVTASGATPQPATTPANRNGKTRVQVFSCGATTPDATTVNGARIVWYDYENSSTATINVGTCSTPASAAWSGAA